MNRRSLNDAKSEENGAECAGIADSTSAWIGADSEPARASLLRVHSAESDVSIKGALGRLRNLVVFDKLVPFSWPGFLFSLFSYLLLLTDMVRSGLGAWTLSEHALLEPNTVMLFGPWAYPVQSIPKNETNGTANVWTYKFDTTSIIWRAFGEYYDIDAFPRCLMYKEPCPEDTFSFVNLFGMMDGIANSTAARRSASALATDPTAVMLRTKSVYYDVLHHYLLPQMFVPPTWRTHQAVYYSPVSLNGGLTSVCHHPRVRPNFCEDLWVNFRRSCIDSDAECQATGVIAIDMMRRYRELQATYPDWQIDLTIMSSQEDAKLYLGGVSFLNKREVDTSTIMRGLRCPPAVLNDNVFRPQGCETMYVEDYRYEGAIATIGAPEWFYVVASLRVIAQGYFYLRLVTLGLACYWTRCAEKKYRRRPFYRKLVAAFQTFAKIPSQCIIYGSPFPIVCYVAAHVIDAPWTYEIVATKFTTSEGIFSITLNEFALIAAVQMRNIWLLALALQLIVYVATHRGGWCITSGIVGIPEYFLSVLSAITICSQYRSLAIRNTHIEEIHRIQHAVGPQIFNNNYNGSAVVEGVMIDFKTLSCLIVAVSMLLYGLHWGGATFDCRHFNQRLARILLARSAVPYSAGTLWSTVALSVCWELRVSSRPPKPTDVSRRPSKVLAMTVRPGATVATRPRASIHDIKSSDTVDEERQNLQHQLVRVHERVNEVHAVVALINLVMMSDPWTFVFLKWFGGHEICVLECESNGKVSMLPLASVQSRQEISVPWDRMRLLKILNTKDMCWSDLIHCG